MGEVIGESVPIAVAVAISPMHLLATILMLLTPRGQRRAGAFVFGRMLGTGLLLVLFSVVIGPVEYSARLPGHVATLGKIVVGSVTLALAAGQWVRGLKRVTDPPAPKWMAGVASFSSWKAFGLGGVLSVASLKNLALCLAGGVVVGSVQLQLWQIILAIVIFMLVGSFLLAAMIVASVAAGPRMQAALEHWRDWLMLHQIAVLSLVLLVAGVVIVSMGVVELTAG